MNQIVAGTDFSEEAGVALDAAAALSRKLGAELRVVHALDTRENHPKIAAVQRLDGVASALAGRFGIHVTSSAVEGSAHEALLEASAARSDMIVVGALGAQRASRLLGGVPERLAQRARCPVVIVREAESFVRWATGNASLGVMVGTGLGESSRAALYWARALPERSLVVAHIAWPFLEHARFGIHDPVPLEGMHPDLQTALLRDLQRWIGDCGGCEAKLVVMQGWGRLDTHLAQLADSEGVQLVVVGSHQRNFLGRIWQGSTARGIIRETGKNVVCVPAGYGAGSGPRASALKTLVIPTALDEISDRALAVGYGMVAEGGVVHLLHVLEADRSPSAEARAREALQQLVPPRASRAEITTQLHVERGSSPAEAITQLAARVGADAVCMTAQTRWRISTSSLGKHALAVLANSRIPVILVPPDHEL
jgi:nucleotide-binding universal stress UspA family protein